MNSLFSLQESNFKGIGIFMSNITVITLNRFGKWSRGCRVHVFLVYLCLQDCIIPSPWTMITIYRKHHLNCQQVSLVATQSYLILSLNTEIQHHVSADVLIVDRQGLLFNISAFSFHHIFELIFRFCYGNSDILENDFFL